MTEPIAITGAGVLSVLGRDRITFAASVAGGSDGLTGAPPMGRLGAHAPPPPDPCPLLAIAAARSALEDAGLAPGPRLALILGTSAGGLAARAMFESDRVRHRSLLRESLTEVQLRHVAGALELSGPALAVTTACTASAHALAHGALLLRAGMVDAVLAGGADAISEPLIAGFTALGAMSDAPCAPFSEPSGMNLGEGACFFVLERADDARARGRAPLAYLYGHGLSSDAHHATAPDPSGGGLSRALRAALSAACVEPGEIGYLNAHGTGTDANDASEMRAIRRVFGAAAERLPISATKSMLGHALGAAAALESLATIEAMRGGFFPSTLHFRRPRPDAPSDPIPAPRSGSFEIAVKTSAAFGGTNAALVFGAHPRPIARAEAEEVFIVGVAEDPGEAPARLDLSGLDRSSELLTRVVAGALASAGIRIRRELADRAGIFAATAHLPWDATREFFQSLKERGRERGSATAFSRMVMNGPAGAASRALSLRGPNSVFAGGCGTTLVALVQASLHLRAGEAELIVVAGAEVADEDLAILGGEPRPESAAAFCLARGDLVRRAGLSPRARIGAVRVGGGDLAPTLAALPRARRTLRTTGPGVDADARLLLQALAEHGETMRIGAGDGRLTSASVWLAGT